VKLIAYFFVIVFALVGLSLIIAATHNNFAFRISVGIVCLLAAVAFVQLARMQPVTHKHIHQMEVDLSGNVSLENLQCRQCGAELDRDSVHVAAGAVLVKCGYCGAEYQLEEEAKW
jgi:hypothetical protein